jgi:hypothetical protein
MEIPQPLKTAELIDYVVTYAHYTATHSFCTGKDSQKDQVSSS